MLRASTEMESLPAGAIASLYALLAGVVLVSCQGTREPPVTAGAGVLVSTSSAGRTVSVDPEKVPLLSACADGELVVRVSSGQWACIAPETLVAALPPTLRPASAQELAAEKVAVDALVARIDQVGVQVEAIDRCGELPAGRRPPNYIFGGASCFASNTDPRGNVNLAYYDQGWLKLRPGMTGKIRVFCPLTPKCDGSDRRWDRLSIRVIDPDGAGSGERLTATLQRHIWDNACRGCLLDSNTDTSTTEKDVSIDLGGVVPDFGAANVDGFRYRLQIELESAGGGIAFGGAVID